MKKPIYVIVKHKLTGRCFTLDRTYAQIDKECTMSDEEMNIVTENWDGWFPTSGVPLWAKHVDDESQFVAYWLDEDKARALRDKNEEVANV